jgi:lipid-A-disaccharide synthase-like uncharacterized protein
MTKHPNTLAGIIALLVFCGIFLQLVLMIQAPSSDSIFEVIIRFFSYFTILSNLIVFAYFISKAMSAELGENGFGQDLKPAQPLRCIFVLLDWFTILFLVRFTTRRVWL